MSNIRFRNATEHERALLLRISKVLDNEDLQTAVEALCSTLVISMLTQVDCTPAQTKKYLAETIGHVVDRYTEYDGQWRIGTPRGNA
jgi:hypothetical protein